MKIVQFILVDPVFVKKTLLVQDKNSQRRLSYKKKVIPRSVLGTNTSVLIMTWPDALIYV